MTHICQLATVAEQSESISPFSSTSTTAAAAASSTPQTCQTSILRVNLCSSPSEFDGSESGEEELEENDGGCGTTQHEGSPASQSSLDTTDQMERCIPCFIDSPVKQTTPPPFALPEGFTEMVLKQQEERRAENVATRAEWVLAQHRQMFHLLPGELRLPALVCESYRHEVGTIHRHQQYLTEAQVENLLVDTRRSYRSMLAEVRRAVRSNPAPAPAAANPASPTNKTKDGTTQPQQPAPQVTVAQHRQNVAQSGVQCFAAMLPYSNGLCGAITDARRALAASITGIPEHVLLDDGFHDLNASSNSNSNNSSAPSSAQSSPTSTTASGSISNNSAPPPSRKALPKGMAVGRTGRFIPISMSAEHGKGDRVALVRRKALATESRPQPPLKKQHRTPSFARSRLPNSNVRNNGSTAASVGISSTSSSVHPAQSYRPRYVDPVGH